MHKLLQQHARDVLPVGLADNQALPAEERQQRLAELTALADKFETLPLYFMKFHGGSDVDDVLDACDPGTDTVRVPCQISGVDCAANLRTTSSGDI